MNTVEPRGFVPKAEREDINVSPAHPMREAALLVGGVLGAAIVLFICFALVIEIVAPLVPPSVETWTLGWWGRHTRETMDESERLRAEALEPILNRLLSRWSDQPYAIMIAVETSPDINAFALPGGTILITTGLLEAVSSEMELAFVLGHELGHFAHRDHMSGVGRAIATGVLEVTLASFGIGQPAINLVNHIDQAASRRFDRRQEMAADTFGVDLLLACYGRADGAQVFLSTLHHNESAHTGGLSYLSTHPATEERLTAIENLLAPSK